MRSRRTASFATAILLLAAIACGSNKHDNISQLPSFVKGTIIHDTYDGTTNDLLTGGLGQTGLGAPTPPAFADSLHPTAAELRTRAIYNNYRALIDFTPGGGYGVLYGPNIDASGNPSLGEGMIAGDEYLAYDDDGTGQQNVTMMVQIPTSFDPNHPCIVTATSSGSRGVYGAIATAGEWGLKHGCAVAYTDKGTGNGQHNLTSNTVSIITGERTDATAAGKNSNFTAPISAGDLATFNASDPNRFAVKHAHSKLNPEKNWGKFTLDAIEFAYYELNQQLGKTASNGKDKLQTFNSGNTIVIASSVSNGGGAALQAAEADTSGLVSAVVVGEPVIELNADPRRQIQRGSQPVAAQGKVLYDWFTIANLFQPCASLSSQVAASPSLNLINTARATNRCAALQAAGLVTSTTTSAQADEALAALHAAGWEKESDLLHASHYALAVPAVAVTYANSYGRFGVEQKICGYTFAATDATTGAPVPLSAALEAQLFASGNGVPPTGGINIVSDTAKNGPILDALAISASTNLADYNGDAAVCLRNLWTGQDANAQAVQTGVKETLRTANVHGKPAILVQGRSDTLVPVNNASRAFMAQNYLAEGSSSNARYWEVANAQHFDTFIAAVPGYAALFVPLHRYFIQAMDTMYDHLRNKTPLPDSQVVRTTPRGSPSTPISAANVPPAPAQAAAADKITFSGNTLVVPD